MDTAPLLADDVEPGRQLDYYLLSPGAGDRREGVVVEEFALRADGTTAALDTACWTPGSPRWWSSASFARGMRGDRELRERVRPAHRSAAEQAYRLLSGAPLPVEPELRAYFQDRHPLPGAAPLRLGPAQVPAGFRERRGYRILFAGDLDRRGLQCLRSFWRLDPVDRAADPLGRVVGRAHRIIDGHDLSWELRRVGADLGWSVDVTALLADGPDGAVPALLGDLRRQARTQGLIPVTVEQLS